MLLSTHFPDEKLRLREGESLAPHLRPSASLTLRRAVSGLLNAACTGCPCGGRGAGSLPLTVVSPSPDPLFLCLCWRWRPNPTPWPTWTEGRTPTIPAEPGHRRRPGRSTLAPSGLLWASLSLSRPTVVLGQRWPPAPPVTRWGGTRLGAPPASSLHRQGPPPSSWPFPAPRKPERPSWSGHLFPAPSGRPSRPGLGSRSPASPVPTPLRARGPGPGMAGLVRPRPGCLLGSRSPSGGASALLASVSCPCPPGPLSFPRSRVWGSPGARDHSFSCCGASDNDVPHPAPVHRGHELSLSGGLSPYSEEGPHAELPSDAGLVPPARNWLLLGNIPNIGLQGLSLQR
ncbi:serine/arginine repetitive matrix protein 1-like [Leopardus geoffroyi]|uniref:serine/arginine repetitive matrix protein 1-like n=1 Tax=Leopardus geoffroyi TaxID=46844 RepID=UPI001E261544|nr:serine/arginine repetitive matrix protein 1-like [Leopardus geoffroyi]XP_045316751.1 serine/arginine repetitive matrix protein 1-like [Leopardus geoffroyi]XP_045316752.1 serine/arginine repetitive matrix protein 1-like [Leopardus geoffroyi]XP_045316753.1 serine/arginine repetitive matrix protein 1-like [Leopardus geoffroyi]